MTSFFANLGSALTESAVAASSMTYSALAPIIADGCQAALKVGQEHIVPAVTEAGTVALKIGQEHVVPAISDAAQRAGPAVAAAGNWVVEHPGQTAWYAGSTLTLAFPVLVAGPVAWAAGWGSVGVRGASAAAAFQAASGSVAAGGVFATLTSYGMGGYGVAAVHGATRIGAAVVGVLGARIGTGVVAA